MKTYCRVLSQWGKEARYGMGEPIGLVAMSSNGRADQRRRRGAVEVGEIGKNERFYAVICGVVWESMSPMPEKFVISGRLGRVRMDHTPSRTRHSCTSENAGRSTKCQSKANWVLGYGYFVANIRDGVIRARD